MLSFGLTSLKRPKTKWLTTVSSPLLNMLVDAFKVSFSDVGSIPTTSTDLVIQLISFSVKQ